MTRDVFINAMSALDTDVVESFAALDAKAHADRSRRHRRSALVSALSTCACAVLVLLVMPLMYAIFGGANAEAPDSDYFADMDELHMELTYVTLYSAVDLDSALSSSIHLSYISSTVAENSGLGGIFKPNAEDKEMNGESEDIPYQLRISATYANGEYTDNVRYYIIFDADNVKSSYIAGYEEQGLTKNVNGVTVHYCHLDDGLNSSQAKFVYNGDLYVINVNAGGTTHNLDTYLDVILEEIKEGTY